MQPQTSLPSTAGDLQHATCTMLGWASARMEMMGRNAVVSTPTLAPRLTAQLPSTAATHAHMSMHVACVYCMQWQTVPRARSHTAAGGAEVAPQTASAGRWRVKKKLDFRVGQ